MSTDIKLLAAQARIKVLRGALEESAELIEQQLSRLSSTAFNARRLLTTPGDTAELDALIADAERYRWLRDCTQSADWEYLGSQTPENTDIAIDAAMKEETP